MKERALGAGHLGMCRSLEGRQPHANLGPLLCLLTRSWLWLNLWDREGLPDQESPGSMTSKSVTRLLSVYLPG